MAVLHDYNHFIDLPDLPYNVISELILHDEDIWKLLKYPDSDALSKANLSLADKRSLIYKGQEDSSPFRVFTVKFTDDAFDLEQTQLRVYTGRITPKEYTIAMVDVVIDVLCHNKIAVLNNYQNRLDVVFQRLMVALNGANVDSVGNLFFNADSNGRNTAALITFNKFYQGYRIVMSTHVG